MSANRQIRDLQIAHQVGLLRLGSGVVNRALASLRLTRPKLVAAVAELLDKLDGTNVTAREAALLADIDKALRPVIADMYKGFRETTRKELLEAGAYEVGFQEALYRGAIPIQVEMGKPSRELVSAAIRSRPFQGKVLSEWFRALEGSAQTRVRDAVRLGMMERETISEIVRRIVGTRARNFRDGVHGISRRRAEAFVRTAVSHATATAKTEFFKANEEIVPQVQLVATLDGRTTPICMARDGQVWKLGEEPQLPFHFNERSTYVGYVDGQSLLGSRPAVRSTKRRGEREIDFRKRAKERAGAAWKDLTPEQRRARIRSERRRWSRENIGTVPAKTTYNEWLKAQPPEFQDQVLGKAKAKAFREGVPVDRFVTKDGRALTVAQLEAQEGILLRTPKAALPSRRPVWLPDDPTRAADVPGQVQVLRHASHRRAAQQWLEGNSTPELRQRIYDNLIGSQSSIATPEVLDSHFRSSWNRTSDGSSKLSHALQEVVREEFDLKDAVVSHWESSESYGFTARRAALKFLDENDDARTMLRGWARTVYEETQAEFQRQNISTVPLWRGRNRGPNVINLVSATQQPLSSWAYSFDEAREFGSAIYYTNVDVRRVFSVGGWGGFGVSGETEVVLLGGAVDAFATRETLGIGPLDFRRMIREWLSER